MYSHITTVAISSTYQTTDLWLQPAVPDSGFSTSTLFPPGNADVSPQLVQLDTCHRGGKAHLAPSYAAHHEDNAMAAAGTRVNQ
jgi:hypothetical protein